MKNENDAFACNEVLEEMKILQCAANLSQKGGSTCLMCQSIGSDPGVEAEITELKLVNIILL